MSDGAEEKAITLEDLRKKAQEIIARRELV